MVPSAKTNVHDSFFTPTKFFRKREVVIDYRVVYRWCRLILHPIRVQQIQALSQALKIPMEVYQANAPVLRTGEEYDCQPILLS